MAERHGKVAQPSYIFHIHPVMPVPASSVEGQRGVTALVPVAPNSTESQRRTARRGGRTIALTLPAAVAGDKVKAQYKDGILTVTLPKAEEAKPKAIAVSE